MEHSETTWNARQSGGWAAGPAPGRLRICAPNARQADKSNSMQEDIFIPPNEINSAMQGDQVLVEVEPPKADGRRMGRIVRILERRNPPWLASFTMHDRTVRKAILSFPSTSA